MCLQTSPAGYGGGLGMDMGMPPGMGDTMGGVLLLLLLLLRPSVACGLSWCLQGCRGTQG